MELVLLLLVAVYFVKDLPSKNWRETTLSDKEFKKLQEHLNGRK